MLELFNVSPDRKYIQIYSTGIFYRFVTYTAIIMSYLGTKRYLFGVLTFMCHPDFDPDSNRVIIPF